MLESATVLIAAAFSIAVIHTFAGPDHYLPFVVLGKAEGWSYRRTMVWALLCGLGHVLSSVVIGGLGIWALIDFILILFREFTDGDGKKLTQWA